MGEKDSQDPGMIVQSCILRTRGYYLYRSGCSHGHGVFAMFIQQIMT